MNLKKLALAAAFTAFAAASAFAARPLEGKKLQMAVSPTFPPFEYVEIDTNTGNEKIVGFDIDMLDQIAERLGFTYEITHTNFKGLMGELSSRRVDFVISGMSPTDERKKSVDFSVPYYYCQTSILQHKGSNIKGISDMKGRKIAASFGTQYCDFAYAVGSDVHAMDNASMSTQELLNGRVDGVVMDAASCSARLKKYPDASLEFHVLPQEDLDKVQGGNVSSCFAAVFPKGSELEPLFSEVIKELKANGFMRKNYEKWIGPMPESSKNDY